MNIYSDNTRLVTLQTKGGVMFFTVEKPELLYRGIVFLSPVRGNKRTRIVCMKKYRYNTQS